MSRLICIACVACAVGCGGGESEKAAELVLGEGIDLAALGEIGRAHV